MFELTLSQSAPKCYALFCDMTQMRLWLPSLKKLKVVSTDERGRAIEATFELGESLSFALVYAYDDAALKVRWVPSAGVLDGVSGFAAFTDAGPHACRFSYSLDSLRGREPEHDRHVALAFAEFVSGALT
jgi:hypothetical protein